MCSVLTIAFLLLEVVASLLAHQAFEAISRFMHQHFSRIGKPLVQFLSRLSEIAAQKTIGLAKGSFLACAYRELCIALIRGEGHVYHSCAKHVI
jgi:hypothetical protein